MSPQRKKLVTEISMVASKMADIVHDADTTTNIPHSEWTVGDMTAHLIISQQIIVSVMTGKKYPHITVSKDFIQEANHNFSKEYIAGLNKKFLSNFSERSGLVLSKLLVSETASFLRDLERFPDEYEVNTHFGKVDLLILLRYCLMHYLIHSSTVAKTLRKPLPVTIENTGLIIPFIKVIMVKLYDKKAAKGFNGNFILAIKGVEAFSLVCTPKGVIIKDKPPQKIDCIVRMDPVIFFLVGNGYKSQWRAFFFGKISLGGKKPWLVITLPSLFKGL